ncbi:hypothetical protein KXV52_000676 [Aspergillus fumigatus]|nr:hypothetical protein KXV97_003868 [Aspergillus fumigatus]KAH2186852.1 hypothetical protein KXW59_009641 [Aspergillus fumigatus]KAH3342022.1 hypothetical protein KXV52_000676 [Aspergillus fumigatus]
MDFHLVPRGTDRNYTGFLTKTIVYASTLLLFLAAFGLTISSIVVPKWVSYHSEKFHYSYGLHRRCSSLTNVCESFPQREDCHGEDRYFCSMWRTVGFLMSFAVVLEGMSVVAYLIVLSGGKRLRESGWKVLSLLIILSALVQAASMSIVAYLYDNEDRFFVGWRLGESWIYCTVSWCPTGVTINANEIASHLLDHLCAFLHRSLPTYPRLLARVLPIRRGLLENPAPKRRQNLNIRKQHLLFTFAGAFCLLGQPMLLLRQILSDPLNHGPDLRKRLPRPCLGAQPPGHRTRFDPRLASPSSPTVVRLLFVISILLPRSTRREESLSISLLRSTTSKLSTPPQASILPKLSSSSSHCVNGHARDRYRARW